MEGRVFLLKKFFIPDCQLVPMSIVDSGWNIDDFGTIGKRVHEFQTAFSSQFQRNVLLSGITSIETEQNPLKNNVSLQMALGFSSQVQDHHKMVLLQGTLWTQKSSMRSTKRLLSLL